MTFLLRGFVGALACALAANVWAADDGDAPEGPAQTAQEVQACARDNLPERTLVQELELHSVDRAGGERRIHSRLFVKRFDDETRATLQVDAPIDVRGVSYLIIDAGGADRIYLYLPEMQRVRRVTGNVGGGNMLGTDLGYADLKHMWAVARGGDVALLESTQIGERQVHVLEQIPDPAEESPYDRVVAFVDRKTCVPLKVEFFAGGETPRKRMTADAASLAQIEGRWLARKMTLRDLRDRTETRLEFLDTHIDKDVSNAIFNRQTFYLSAYQG